MLTEYLRAALRRAEYEKLEEGGWFGRIPELDGLWADGESVEACRERLQSALEDWVVFGLVNGFPVPPIDGIDLSSAKVA
ncbi:MAG TPA: type II toxin-antitoxin system HicB family antitoxin [Candidatus Limnocylindrales bacterium]|nr:type II toxin-antitoxin system HicB family antitoxin [Candidatus Limnocylindrales bacterium]